MKPLSSKARFEKWAKRHELMLDRTLEMSRSGPHWVYMSPMTEASWQAWTAARRAFT